MRSKLALVLGIVVIGVVAYAVPALSHHSHGNYTQDTKDMEGVVTEVHALNPHSWVYVNVTDASGKAQLWALEGGGARGLQELAKVGKGLKAGDKVKVRVHPLRDGSAGALLGFIKHPDGIVRNYDQGAEEVKGGVQGF
jgi:hypothetical protein